MSVLSLLRRKANHVQGNPGVIPQFVIFCIVISCSFRSICGAILSFLFLYQNISLFVVVGTIMQSVQGGAGRAVSSDIDGDA